MTHVYGSSMLLTVEANKENIPPGMEIKKEPFVYPEPRVNRTSDQDQDPLSPVPRPSPAMSQLSDASFLSQDGAAVNTSADEAEDDSEITSRKEKSLGLLCQRFLIAINEETVGSSTREVHLETVARKMSVEKRRIYDIVNVMEALDAMQKTNKSYYQWQGLESLPKLMADLQTEAIEEGLPERVLRVEQAMCSFTELASPSARGGKPGFKDIVGSFVGCTSTQTTPSTSFDLATVKIEPGMQEKRSRVDNRDRQGRNSLAQLCRRFLMVLLSNPKNVRKVSLDVASTVLIKDPETEGFEPPSRSRCRRLYDIANVLVALGLIKKVHYLFGTKKIPLFVYCGPEPDVNGSFDVFSSVERLLSSPQNIPQTPVIKAQTDKIVQQIAGFGKRTFSDLSLSKPLGNVPKMAKMKSEKAIPQSPAPSSLFMFAELAAAEKMRLDAFAQLSRSLLGTQVIPPTASSTGPPPLPVAPLQLSNLRELPKPQAHKQFVFPAVGPKQSFPFADYTPTSYSPSTLRPLVSQMTFKRSPAVSPMPHRPMHMMSNILGDSKKFKNDQNASNSFEHTNSSPFQVVKKGETRPKKVFGEIQNFQ